MPNTVSVHNVTDVFDGQRIYVERREANCLKLAVDSLRCTTLFVQYDAGHFKDSSHYVLDGCNNRRLVGFVNKKPPLLTPWNSDTFGEHTRPAKSPRIITAAPPLAFRIT